MNRSYSFTRNQRIGVIILLFIIVTLQIVYFFVDWSSSKSKNNNPHFYALEKELDSLRNQASNVKKDTFYPFNPNFITDYKGFNLGMSPAEIDRLLAFRKQNKYVNSSKEFQEVTQISDSLLAKISPYFKFPEWINNSKTERSEQAKKELAKKVSAPKQDINQATKEDLMKVYGIGQVFSERILKYRERLQGFTSMAQLIEVYGLEQDVVDRISEQFEVKHPPQIEKKNINNLNRSELAKIPYLSFEDAKKIIMLRSELGNISNLDELLKINEFNTEKIEKIQIYLYAE